MPGMQSVETDIQRGSLRSAARRRAQRQTRIAARARLQRRNDRSPRHVNCREQLSRNSRQPLPGVPHAPLLSSFRRRVGPLRSRCRVQPARIVIRCGRHGDSRSAACIGSQPLSAGRRGAWLPRRPRRRGVGRSSRPMDHAVTASRSGARAGNQRSTCGTSMALAHSWAVGQLTWLHGRQCIDCASTR